VVLITVTCLLTTDVGLYLRARRQARNAADAAALAAVQESFPLFSSGKEPSEAARRFARANGASHRGISVGDGGMRVEASTSVRPGSLLLGLFGLGGGEARATSAAEVDLEALLAGGRIWYTPDPATLKALVSALAEYRVKDAGGVSTMIALLALSHLGKPYVWGAEGPDSFDCSGLVCYVYAQIGVRLPRVTYSQARCGRAVPPGDLRPGDLVFFRHNAHVGLYVGGGLFVHAPHTGDVVKTAALSSRSDVSACRRLF
jgi:cell wall-associated NlpC family hydrolase